MLAALTSHVSQFGRGRGRGHGRVPDGAGHILERSISRVPQKATLVCAVWCGWCGRRVLSCSSRYRLWYFQDCSFRGSRSAVETPSPSTVIIPPAYSHTSSAIPYT